jgi:hypothetical protein
LQIVQFLEGAVQLVVHHGLLDIAHPVVLAGSNEVAQRRGGVRRGGLVEAGRDARESAQAFAFGLGHAGCLGELLVGWLAREDRRQFRGRGFEALELLSHLEGDPYRAAVLLDGALQRLANPPGRVGRELESPLPIELLHRAQ